MYGLAKSRPTSIKLWSLQNYAFSIFQKYATLKNTATCIWVNDSDNGNVINFILKKFAQSILQLLVLTYLKANEVFQVCTFAILWNRRTTKSVLKSNPAGNKQRWKLNTFCYKFYYTHCTTIFTLHSVRKIFQLLSIH